MSTLPQELLAAEFVVSRAAQPEVDLLWTHVLFFGAENPNYISEQTRPRVRTASVVLIDSFTLWH
jgi:hypothetical protein